jgi:hypothetical protein
VSAFHPLRTCDRALNKPPDESGSADPRPARAARWALVGRPGRRPGSLAGIELHDRPAPVGGSRRAPRDRRPRPDLVVAAALALSNARFPPVADISALCLLSTHCRHQLLLVTYGCEASVPHLRRCLDRLHRPTGSRLTSYRETRSSGCCFRCSDGLAMGDRHLLKLGGYVGSVPAVQNVDGYRTEMLEGTSDVRTGRLRSRARDSGRLCSEIQPNHRSRGWRLRSAFHAFLPLALGRIRPIAHLLPGAFDDPLEPYSEPHSQDRR